MQSKIKNQLIIRSHFDVHKTAINYRNDVDNISKNVISNKCKKNERNEKIVSSIKNSKSKKQINNSIKKLQEHLTKVIKKTVS